MSRKTSWVVITLCVVAAVSMCSMAFAEDYGTPVSTADNGAELRPSGNQGNGNHNGGNGQVDTLHVGTLQVDEMRVNSLVIASGGTVPQPRNNRRGNGGGAGAARPSGPTADQTARTAAKNAQDAARAAKTAADNAQTGVTNLKGVIGDWDTAREGTMAAEVRALKMYQESDHAAIGDWDTDGKGSIADNIGNWDLSTNGTITEAMTRLDNAGKKALAAANSAKTMAIVMLVALVGLAIVVGRMVLKPRLTPHTHPYHEGRIAALEAAAGITPPPPPAGPVPPPAPGGPTPPPGGGIGLGGGPGGGGAGGGP